MDANKTLLKKQIEESYGRMLYTYVAHQKQIEELECCDCCVKFFEIVSCIVSVVALVADRFLSIKGSYYFALAGVVFSLVIVLFSYAKNYRQRIYFHTQTVNELWLIRERFHSLLVDLDRIPVEKVADGRDKLISDLNTVYSHALPTGRESYEAAQKAIKNNEQGFDEQELEKLLPHLLRNKGDKES